MASIIIKPDLYKKLDILADGAKYDVCMSSCNSNGKVQGRVPDPKDPDHKWIYPAHLPGGGFFQILKILQSNRCVNKCKYCGLSAGKDGVKRVALSSDELAKSFMDL